MTVCAALFILMLCPTALATGEAETQQAQKAAYGINEAEQAIPQEARELLGDVRIENASDPESLFDRILDAVGLNFGEILRDSLRNVSQILLVGMLTTAFCFLSSGKEHAVLTSMTGAMTAAVLGASQACSCIPQSAEIIRTLSDYSGKLLPALCASAAAGGAITSAGAKYAIASTVLNLFCLVSIRLLIPFAYQFTALVIAAHVFQNDLLLSVASVAKRLLKLLMLGTAGILSVLLALTGAVQGAADTVAAKAAKATVSTVLPVVGGILSDAAATLASGASYMCSGIGIVGIACVLSVCVLPYLMLGAHYLLYRCMSAFCASVADHRFSGLLNGLSDVYAILMGLTGTAAFAVCASILSLTRAVST